MALKRPTDEELVTFLKAIPQLPSPPPPPWESPPPPDEAEERVRKERDFIEWLWLYKTMREREWVSVDSKTGALTPTCPEGEEALKLWPRLINDAATNAGMGRSKILDMAAGITQDATQLEDGLNALGLKPDISQRLAQNTPEVAELLLALAAGDDARVDRLLAEIHDDSSEAARHLREDLQRHLRKNRSLTFQFSVVFEPEEEDPSVILASVPALSGCYTSGDGIDDARMMALDAAREWLASWVEADGPVPNDNTVDADGKSTLTPEPGQTVEVIAVTVIVPVPPAP